MAVASLHRAERGAGEFVLILRPYQQTAISAVAAHWRSGTRSVLLVAELYDAEGVTLATSTEAELPPYSTTDGQARAWCEKTAREKGWTPGAPGTTP